MIPLENPVKSCRLPRVVHTLFTMGLPQTSQTHRQKTTCPHINKHGTSDTLAQWLLFEKKKKQKIQTGKHQEAWVLCNKHDE